MYSNTLIRRMTYYEELGLTPGASRDEIHRAYRTVAKLLHPDCQSDPVLHKAASLQLQRINGIVQILLNPQRREQYDASLLQLGMRQSQREWRPRYEIAGLCGTVAAAVSVSLIGLWVLGGDALRLGSDRELVLYAAPGKREIASAPIPTPAPTQPVPVRRPTHLSGHDRVSALPGAWNYSAPRRHDPIALANEPDSAQILLESGDGIVRGRCTFIFWLPGFLSPFEFVFAFEGPANSRAPYLWHSDDGSHGTVQLEILSTRSMAVNWRCTEFANEARLIPDRLFCLFRKEGAL